MWGRGHISWLPRTDSASFESWLGDPTKTPWGPFFSTQGHYLDQPTRGGAAQARAMTQVKATPMMAWFSPKRKLLMGLHTTTYRSMAKTTKDHRAISPARQSGISQHTTHLDPAVCPSRKRSSWNGEGSQEGKLGQGWSQDQGWRDEGAVEQKDPDAEGE